MNAKLIEKLTTRFAGSEISKLALAGDVAGAADLAAGTGVWGLWAELREAAGLPSDDAARAEWLAAYKARRAAKFAKR